MNSTSNGLDKIIFEYLNFRPFLEELSDKTKLISEHIESYYNKKKVDNSYTFNHIVRCDEGWKINREHSYIRANLYYIFEQRLTNLKIKDNFDNFEYGNGLNLCYIYY